MAYEDRYVQAPKYECLLFGAGGVAVSKINKIPNLDDTLYPLSSGLSKEVPRNIQDFMVEKLGIDKNKTNDLANLLYKNYGTTMAGLRAIGYDFDYDEYHSFVHGRLPYENLKADPVLRNLLLNSPIRKVIFTNADEIHAVKALRKLGLEDCFEGIICFETLNPVPVHKVCGWEETKSSYSEIFDIVAHFGNQNDATTLPNTPVICKPSEYAFHQALKLANLNPHKTIFFDDSVRNILAAKRVGLHTVLVGTCQRAKGADYALESIHNLREALPELWEADVRAQVYSDKISRETSVIA